MQTMFYNFTKIPDVYRLFFSDKELVRAEKTCYEAIEWHGPLNDSHNILNVLFQRMSVLSQYKSDDRIQTFLGETWRNI